MVKSLEEFLEKNETRKYCLVIRDLTTPKDPPMIIGSDKKEDFKEMYSRFIKRYWTKEPKRFVIYVYGQQTDGTYKRIPKQELF